MLKTIQITILNYSERILLLFKAGNDIFMRNDKNIRLNVLQ